MPAVNRMPYGTRAIAAFGRSASLGVVGVFAGLLFPGIAAVAAQDNLYFMRTSSGDSGANDHAADREFIREWEANPPIGFPTLSRSNIEPTRKAIAHYTEVVAKGGWKTMPEQQLRVGDSGPAVALLHERLALSGDLREDPGMFSSAARFGSALEKAVRRFQASNGLTPTGIVDKRTIAALNVPASARLKQLKVGLQRLEEWARSGAKRYVVVNIPAAQIEAVENDKVVSRHAGVVGKIDRPTPLLRSAISDLNFNPVWTLPPTVIQKDLVPKGREMQKAGRDVLVKFGIDAYDRNGRKLDPETIDWSSGTPLGLSYRQQAGKENPLGFLKINFESAQSVYMHDTPSDSLFGRNFRAASSGCVRVQNIESLAGWLLAENGGWSDDRIKHMKETREHQDVRLKKPVPLFFVYITAWATEDGVVQFRRDLYNKDGVGATASAY